MVDLPAPIIDERLEVRRTIELHRQTAIRLLHEGSAAQSLKELVRATRSVPMRAPLASLVVRLALAAGHANPAIAVLTQSVDETDGRDRLAVMRALSRLFRRTDDRERARETLVQLLAEYPKDRRARFVLNALLERDERWGELDASLERETLLAERHGAMRTASTVASRRARLWGERLGDPARAALRYGQAAAFSEQANDLQGAFLVRLLQVQSLHRSKAPARVLHDIALQTLELAERTGQGARAFQLFKQLGLERLGPALRPKGLTSSTSETAIAAAPLQSTFKGATLPLGGPVLLPKRRARVDASDVRGLEGGRAPDDDGEFETGTIDFTVPFDDEEIANSSSAPRRSTVELPAVTAAATSFGSPTHDLRSRLESALAQIAREPLESDHYRQLADLYDNASDPSRSSLMLEVALALDGDPNAAPRTPRLILSEADRFALKHPLLRTEAAEMISLLATALCRLFPARSHRGGFGEEFRLDAGKGAKPTADALLAAVRILGVRAPQVHVSQASGPPFSVVLGERPTLLVGRLAIKKPSPDAELRFYAGRALFTLSHDLLPLRSITPDQLLRGLQIVSQVLQGSANAVQARLVVADLSSAAWERLKMLVHTQLRVLELGPLVEGARHSANRAGLLVCGGIAPAIEALRAKRALAAEMVELVRFAASDVYLELRGRTFAGR